VTMGVAPICVKKRAALKQAYRGHGEEHLTGLSTPGDRAHSVLVILDVVARYTILVQRLTCTQ